MGNKKISVFASMIGRIKDMRYVGISRSYLLNGKQWGRNAETFYASNLIKLGYLKESKAYRNCITYCLAKEIPDGYNSSSLRKEMKKKKNLMKI